MSRLHYKKTHPNEKLARSKPAYKDSEVLPREPLVSQLRDYVFIHDRLEAKLAPDFVPFNPNECLSAAAALEGSGIVDYKTFRQLVKNSWVRDEVWYLAGLTK